MCCCWGEGVCGVGGSIRMAIWWGGDDEEGGGDDVEGGGDDVEGGGDGVKGGSDDVEE